LITFLLSKYNYFCHDKLSGKIYRLLFKLCISGKKDIPWMNYIKSIFDETTPKFQPNTSKLDTLMHQIISVGILILVFAYIMNKVLFGLQNYNKYYVAV
jgi:hypothetical protein